MAVRDRHALHVLAVDDEIPALEELAYLLREATGIDTVHTAANGQDALRVLQREPVEAIFLDIRMPGLDGLEIARVLTRFACPPKVVFVTAYDNFAVDAFDLEASDYVLKPLRQERLAETVRRLCEGGPVSRGVSGGVDSDIPEEAGTPDTGSAVAGQPSPDETIPVELGGVTRFIARSEVQYAEAHGDYVRLYTAAGSHLVRIPLTVLEERWASAGFVRIHRSHLVAIAHIDELRWEGSRVSVRIGSEVLPVSRRQARELRDRLLHGNRPSRGGPAHGSAPRRGT